MAINIQSLFQDIIETPAQRQQRMLQEGILKGRELTSGLTGLARTQAPLVSALMMNMPQQQEALRRGVGGMLGLDVRSESEKVQDALKNVDPNNPQSLLQAAQMIQGLGLGSQAAQMRQMAADVTRQKEADLLARQQASADIARNQEAALASRAARINAQAEADAQRRYRDHVANLIVENNQYHDFSEGIRDGSVPIERVEKIVDDITEKIDPKNLTIVQAIVGGNHKTLGYDGYGGYYTLNGQKIALAEDDKVAPASVTGPFEDVAGVSQSKRDALNDLQIQTSNFIASANNLIDFITENPSANTWTAAGFSVANSLLAESTAAISAANPKVKTKISDYSNVFSDLGIVNDQLKTGILGLALQYAAASGLGENRALTDKDVERAIEAIGASKSDPNSIKLILTARKKELEDRFRNAYYFTTGDRYTNSLDPFSSRQTDYLFK